MAQISELINVVSQNFTFSEGLMLLKELAVFLVGITLYSVFIFKFYHFLARKDIFTFKVDKNSKHKKLNTFAHIMSYIFKHVLVLPLIIFFWFIVLSLILAFLSKQGSMQTILIISISLVGVIRITAYYNEDLSKDLAKMLPFALLGVFLVDISFFSLSDSFETIKQLPGLWKLMVYYLLFIILLEFILRIGDSLFRAILKIDTDEKV